MQVWHGGLAMGGGCDRRGSKPKFSDVCKKQNDGVVLFTMLQDEANIFIVFISLQRINIVKDFPGLQ